MFFSVRCYLISQLKYRSNNKCHILLRWHAIYFLSYTQNTQWITAVKLISYQDKMSTNYKNTYTGMHFVYSTFCFILTN